MKDSLHLWFASYHHRGYHHFEELSEGQKIIEIVISLLMVIAYGLIIGTTGITFYFFFSVNNFNSEPGSNCIINDSYYCVFLCILAYPFQLGIALGAFILMICSLVKSCVGVWYSERGFTVDIIILILCLLSAMAMCLLMMIGYIGQCNDMRTPECKSQDQTSLRNAFISSWGVLGIVLITIIVESFLTIVVKKCRKRTG